MNHDDGKNNVMYSLCECEGQDKQRGAHSIDGPK